MNATDSRAVFHGKLRLSFAHLFLFSAESNSQKRIKDYPLFLGRPNPGSWTGDPLRHLGRCEISPSENSSKGPPKKDPLLMGKCSSYFKTNSHLAHSNSMTQYDTIEYYRQVSTFLNPRRVLVPLSETHPARSRPPWHWLQGHLLA